jgi:nitrite reductase/ring-hydroxylating ferredoxin subunit
MMLFVAELLPEAGMGDRKIRGHAVVIAHAPDWQDNSMAPVEVGEHRIALCKIDGVFYAFDDHCPHAGSTVALGNLNGEFVECPRHEFVWRVTDGESMMRWHPLNMFDVWVEGTDVIMDMPDQWPELAHLRRHPKRDELIKKFGYRKID